MAKIKSKKFNIKSTWLFVVGAFIVLFAIFYYALSHRAYAPSQTNQETRTTGESAINRYDAPTIIKSSDGEESIWHNSYYPQVLFSLNTPAECKIGKQSSHGVMPNFANISCNGKDIVIIPYAGGHGLGQAKITKDDENITLNGTGWERVIFSSDEWPVGSKVSTYTLRGGSILMEVDYSNYSIEDQDLVETIMSTFKLTK